MIDTYNADFYPTPSNLIEEMLKDINWHYVNTILEPSAGKGNLAESISKSYTTTFQKSRYSSVPKINLDCIEKEEELAMILKGKDFRVVHDDFLSFNTFKKYDLIIANPPFSCGDAHLLKMISLQERFGGNIICLLNAETIKNPYSNQRKLLLKKLNEYDASIKYYKNAFSNAERKTDVEVVLIKINIPTKENVSNMYEDSLKKAQEQRETKSYNEYGTELATNDLVKNIVMSYNIEVEAGIKLIQEVRAFAKHNKMNFPDPNNVDRYGKPFEPDPMLIITLNEYGQRDKPLSINQYIEKVRKKYWKALFSNKKFTGNLTKNLYDHYMSKLDTYKDYDFTEYNINVLRHELTQNMSKSIEDTIVSLFDSFTSHYYDETKKNIHLFDGWKTNSCWIVNKKVIEPYMNAFNEWDGSFKPCTNWDLKQRLDDIEKVFKYLDTDYSSRKVIDLNDALQKAQDNDNTKNIEFTYFYATFYKKKTCHIIFKDEELLKKFNIFGAMHKGWLPPSYCKKSYNDMTEEEKNVVESFHKSNCKATTNKNMKKNDAINDYTSTLQNKNKYIVNPTMLLTMN